MATEKPSSPPAVVSKVLAKVDEVISNLPPPVTNILTKIETQHKIPKAYVAIGLVLIPFLLLFFFLGGDGIIVSLVGFVWPAIESFKAIESPDKKKEEQWLKYWVLYGFVVVFETVFSFLVAMIPSYSIVKMAFLVYCYHPKFNGAQMIYNVVLKPYVVPHLVKPHKA